MRNKSISIVLSVLAVLSLCSIIFTAFIVLNNTPSITQINYDASSNIKPFTVSKAVEIDERINEIYVGTPTLSFCAEAEKVEVRNNTVTPVLVNERFFENYKINVENLDENSVVISKDLALKLYLNTDAVGKPFKLFNKTYTVAAVYDGFKGLCTDNKQRVYVLYNSVKDYEGFDVQEFACKNGSQSAIAFTQMKLEN
ncbi:MAG: ABC transporter permease, partial [Ruminococcus sp.]|nr:ABC transporter permease [Ruminococcus sp.]